MTTITSRAIINSFGNTPQAGDDLFTSVFTGLTEDSGTFLLDVMGNDGGGKAKTLWSLDDGDTLALLIAAQHQGMLGWRQVQAHDVFEFLDELGIARNLQATHDVGLQAVLSPNPMHHGVADPEHLGQTAGAPSSYLKND